MNCLKVFCRIGFKKLLAACYKPKKITEVEVFRLKFINRIGLGAGFDKNAKYLNELEALGFGFIEIGTVTPLPQAGNNKPRLFRLPQDKALINRMGFNNDGVEEIAQRIQKFKIQNSKFKIIIGGNIGKNKSTPNEDAWKDYEICFNMLHSYVDYFVVNVSSPNTPGLRELQEKDSLKKILTHLQFLNTQLPSPKPILLKISPDLTMAQINDIVDLIIAIKLDGLIVANTTTDRPNLITKKTRLTSIGAGGLSGLPLKDRNTEMIRYIYQRTKGEIPIVASGGIFTAKDAREKIAAGATLIQVWTGFVYEGPGIVKKICKGFP